MPSPLGHALGGAAVGLLVSGPPAGWSRDAVPTYLSSPIGRAVVLAVIACSPDLDLLVGNHSAQTHSVGAVIVVVLLLLVWTRNTPFALAGGAAYASHLLFDWLGRDTSPPLGIMALWPLTSDYYISPVPLLEPVSRRYWLPGFWAHNLKVALSELALFGALAALAWRRGAAGGKRS